jgi:hypothetical protein
MHVVQMMYISFYIDYEAKLGIIENEADKNMFIIKSHQDLFISICACAEQVKDVVLGGQEIIQTLEY